MNAYKTKYQVEFSLNPKDNPNIAYSPSNMVYKNDTANSLALIISAARLNLMGF
ncbi:hypothetical protein COL0002_01220 [Helicobacter pylori]